MGHPTDTRIATCARRERDAYRPSEKSTLWTDAGVDQKFQRDLGAIGSYEFQGKSIWTNPLVPCFQGYLYGPMALKVCQNNPPRLALVHGWLFQGLKGKDEGRDKGRDEELG